MLELSIPPRRYALRPALTPDRWQIQKLLHAFEQETAIRPARETMIMRYALLGLVAAVGVHLVLTLGLSVFLCGLGIAGLGGVVLLLDRLLSDEWHKFWVIEQDGHIIACAKLCHYRHYSVLFNVLVAYEWRNQGIGSHLVNHLANSTDRPLYLACHPNKVKFYARFGFAEIAPQTLSPLLRHDLGLTTRADIVPLVLV